MNHSVIIIEDDNDLRGNLEEYMKSDSDLDCLASFSNFEDFLRYCQNNKFPNLLLVDIGLPGMNGIDGIKLLRKKTSEIEIIILTIFNDHHKIFDSLSAGAVGYILKSTPYDEILSAIKLIANGGGFMSPQIAKKVSEFFMNTNKRKEVYSEQLTNRENEIVKFLVEGDTYQLIADSLFISIETVRHHIKKIYRKLQVNTRFEVMKKFSN